MIFGDIPSGISLIQKNANQPDFVAGRDRQRRAAAWPFFILIVSLAVNQTVDITAYH
jgi:hypothetical protein